MRRRTTCLGRWGVLAFWVVLLVHVWGLEGLAGAQQSKPAPQRSASRAAPATPLPGTLVDEMVGLLQANAPVAPVSGEEIVFGLRAFIRAVDRYGDYLRPEVLDALRALETGSYGGIGLSAFRDRSERVVCIPVPEGPAARAGVVYGQQLLEVAGHSTTVLNAEDIGFLLRGEPGTQVALTVYDQNLKAQRKISVTRASLHLKTVYTIATSPVPVVRIVKFTRNTPLEFAAALRKLDLESGLVLDLRGNVGGDLTAAIQTAGMLLSPGVTVCAQRGRKETTVHRAAGQLFRPRRIVLWQDRLTVSAAEVFLAAFVENRQGIGLGQVTFGKGASQTLFPLRQGGALLVTNALLVTPLGNLYDGIGLAPAYRLPEDPTWSDAAYWTKTREIFTGADS